MPADITVDTSFNSTLLIDPLPALRQGVRAAQRSGQTTVVSVSAPAPELDVVMLFERGQLVTADRYLWAQPDEDFALVGLGIARAVDVVEATRFRQAADAWRRLMVGAIHEGPRRLPGVGPILMGGFSFDTRRGDSRLWQGYPPGHLVLPRLLFTRAHGESWVTYNAVVSAASDPEAEAARLAAMSRLLFEPDGLPWRPDHHPPGLGAPRPASITEHELRPADEWQADVADAVRAIGRGELEKVVLARAVRLQSEQPFSPASALRHLVSHYPDCYLFAVARGLSCFLGATPEQLVRLREREVKAMSLAGSIRRGQTREEDERLGRALLASAKDRDEHAVVVRAMVEALGGVCSRLQVSETPELLRLGNIQHLCTPLTGQLSDSHTLLDLVERLHPTPAVGGRPRSAALQLIRECEKLDRGWYAGAVGWLDQDGEGEFCVAIRSALLHANEATLFAGCGIVTDSDPEREYAESRLKLRPMLDALTAPNAGE
jgi:menaquinone-specific isochorismate synthase